MIKTILFVALSIQEAFSDQLCAVVTSSVSPFQNVQCYDGRVWSWSPRPLLLSASRSSYGATVWNGKNLCILGGQTPLGVNVSDMANVDCFGGASWKSQPSLPAGISNANAVAFNGNLYALGGQIANAIQTNVDTLSPLSGSSWVSAPPLPAAVSFFGAEVFQGRLYVLGGNDASDNYLSNVYSFNGTAWRTEPNLPTNRCCFATEVFNGRLCMIGGNDGTDYLYDVSCYNGATWQTRVTNLPRSKVGMAGSIVTAGHLWVLGGYGYDSVDQIWGDLSYVDVFDGSSWVTQPNMLSIGKTTVALLNLSGSGGTQRAVNTQMSIPGGAPMPSALALPFLGALAAIALRL